MTEKTFKFEKTIESPKVMDSGTLKDLNEFLEKLAYNAAREMEDICRKIIIKHNLNPEDCTIRCNHLYEPVDIVDKEGNILYEFPPKKPSEYRLPNVPQGFDNLVEYHDKLYK